MKQQNGAHISTKTIAKIVGRKIRAARKQQRMTLLALAKASGVALATISRVERGRMTGTLESHAKLVRALNLHLADLYAELDGRKGAADVSAVQSVHVQASRATSTLLTSDVVRKKLTPLLITVAPNGSTQKEQAGPGTERFLYVLQGEMRVRVGNEEYQLRRGDALYLDAWQPHVLKNLGSSEAKCLSVVTAPA